MWSSVAELLLYYKKWVFRHHKTNYWLLLLICGSITCAVIYYYYYFLSFLEERRASAKRLHAVRFSTNNFTWLHDFPQALISSSHPQLHVTLGWPAGRRFPFGFHSTTGLVCDVTWRFNQSVSNPSPSTSAYLLRYCFLFVGLFPEMSVVDLFGEIWFWVFYYICYVSG